MSDIVPASPTNNVKGVVIAQPGQIRGAIKAAVAEALAGIPPGKQGMAEVAVDLDTGVNLVYAHKTPDGKWTAAAWVGRTWEGDISGGAVITRTW